MILGDSSVDLLRIRNRRCHDKLRQIAISRVFAHRQSRKIHLINKQYIGGGKGKYRAIVTYNGSIIKKDDGSFVEHVCQLAPACISLRAHESQRRQRTVFPPVNVRDSFLLGPLFHRNDQDALLFPAGFEIAS